MSRDLARILAPTLAVALFAFVLVQTFRGLQDSGVWRLGRRPAAVVKADPLAELDARLARARDAVRPAGGRDPFAFGNVAPRPDPGKPVVRRPPPPPVPETPLLTAIVWDADPRALVRWKGRDWTVRSGGFFDDFEVVRISRDQVVLRRGGESIVLQRKPQGE